MNLEDIPTTQLPSGPGRMRAQARGAAAGAAPRPRARTHIFPDIFRPKKKVDFCFFLARLGESTNVRVYSRQRVVRADRAKRPLVYISSFFQDGRRRTLPGGAGAEAAGRAGRALRGVLRGRHAAGRERVALQLSVHRGGVDDLARAAGARADL
jgi:hypothetical protein